MDSAFKTFASLILTGIMSCCAIGKEQTTTETVIDKRGENLFLLGNFDSFTLDAVVKEIDKSPQITRIVFTANGGSNDDNVTLQLGRFIRQKKLETHVLEGGVIASGGVSLFLAGVKRSIGKNVYIGVHAWQHCSGSGTVNCKSAKEYALTDTAHRLHNDYVSEMLSTDSFYWFSINAAPPNSIHWLSSSEIKAFKLVNHSINENFEIPFFRAFQNEYENVCHNCPTKNH
ncbi:hypothetical protein ACYTPF_11860 [Alteromonas sp. HB246098]